MNPLFTDRKIFLEQYVCIFKRLKKMTVTEILKSGKCLFFNTQNIIYK